MQVHWIISIMEILPRSLRTALIKENYIYVQAGAGIVADSIAKNEFKETENKV